MTPTACEEVVYRWATAVLCEEWCDAIVYYSDQSGPRPPAPCASISRIADETPGMPDVVTTDEMVGSLATRRVTERRYESISLQCYGEDADAMAKRLQLSVWRSDVRAALAEDQATIAVMGRPRRVVVPLDTVRESRVVMELLVGTIVEETTLVEVASDIAPEPTLT